MEIQQGNRKPNMSNIERNAVAQFLYINSKDGELKRGVIKEASAKFRLERTTIRSIWKNAKAQIDEGMPINLTNKKIGLAKGSKLMLDRVLLKAVKHSERGTIRGLAASLKVSTSTAWRWVKSGLIRPHSNAIKPDLTPKCKISRLKWCLNSIEHTGSSNNWIFKSMNHIVHIDEKWFYLTKQSEKYYLLEDEPEPHRACKSKKFITKVMFLCAVSRPLYNIDGSLIFDGKIGIFPFTHQVAAQRNSKRRARGTLETKATQSITKEVIKSCLIDKVLPAIKQKWPLFENTDILIQQDNARPHIDDGDLEFRAAASSDGFNIHLICQPTNSPDLNINDLGWFRALQSLQTKRASYNIDELVEAVQVSFSDLDHQKLNNVFLSLQNCMIEILKVKGHNNYRQPHMNKAALMRQGILPQNLSIEKELVQECVDYLVDAGESSDMGYYMEAFEDETMLQL